MYSEPCYNSLFVPVKKQKTDSFSFLHRKSYHLKTKTVICLPFLSVYHLFPFSCLTALVKTSNMILTGHGKSTHPYLVPDLRDKDLSFIPLNLMLAVVFIYLNLMLVGSLYQIEKVSFHS